MWDEISEKRLLNLLFCSVYTSVLLCVLSEHTGNTADSLASTVQ